LTTRALLLTALVALAACASTPGDFPDVETRAVAESGGLRVWFRCLEPPDGPRAAVLEAAGGRVREVVRSADRGTLSALWLGYAPDDVLACRFPNGAAARVGPDHPADAHDVDYTFVKREWGNVTARVPRGCPMKPILILRVFVEPGGLPGALRFPDGRTERLVDPVSVHVLALPRDRDGRLAAGEQELELRAADGRTAPFLVGVDRDGTPVATSGWVRNW